MKYTQTITHVGSGIALAAILLGAGASLAFAQEVDAQKKGPFWDLRQEHRDARAAFKAERATIKEDRGAFRAEVKEARDAAKADAKAMRDSFRERLQAAATDEEKAAIKEEAKAAREAFKAERQEVRGAFKEKAKGYASSHLNRVMQRLDAAGNRFDQLVDRVQSFLNEKAAQGIDVSAAQSELNAASTAAAHAKTQIANAKAVIERVLASDTPRDHKDEVKAAVRTAVESIKAAQKELKEAVRAAKALN